MSPMLFSGRSEARKELSTQWVLIIDFSGLSEIYLVRITRLPMPLSILTEQFDGHLLRYGSCMEKVLHAVKKRNSWARCVLQYATGNNKRLFGKSQQ
jgi:hypothetical protein